MMEMVIAECPSCGTKRYSWEKEDAIYKLSQHRCPFTLLDEELNKILYRIIKKEDNEAEHNKEEQQDAITDGDIMEAKKYLDDAPMPLEHRILKIGEYEFHSDEAQ